MSSFSYGKHTKKHIGCWLRVHSPFNEEILSEIKKTGNKRLLETVRRIVVNDYFKSENKVVLEIWCSNAFNEFLFKKHRYNVFYLTLELDENWTVEGDLCNGIYFN